MAVEGIANLGKNLADQLFGQKRETPAATHTLGTGREGNEAVTEDTFTPSTQNNSGQASAQDAGIFQVSQVALSDVTANILFEQASPNANQNGAPAQAGPAATSGAGTAQTATGVAAATTNVQDQLRALNATLPALGLTNAEIQLIDRIASLIQDFNPAAFANLVNQFEALAQQAAQQGAANAGVNPSTVANTNAGTSANGGGFQVQEIRIKFTGLQETVNNAAGNNGGQGSTANNFQITAASLQIEQVQFTLTNGNGQTVQVQAPQQNTNAGTTNQQPTPTQVAAA